MAKPLAAFQGRVDGNLIDLPMLRWHSYESILQMR
jgi:hypothetical protein